MAKQKRTKTWRFENSQPIQGAKDDKIKNFTARKTCSRGEKNAEGKAGQSFANTQNDQMVSIFSHIKCFLKRLVCDSHISTTSLKAKNRERVS